MTAATPAQITALATAVAARTTALAEGRFPHPNVAAEALRHDRAVLRRWQADTT